MTADLSALIARLEAAEVGSRELDAAICIAANYVGAHQDFTPENLRLADDADEDDSWLDYEVAGDDCTDTTPKLTTSLDAALALAERVLPLWCAVAEWTPSNDHPSGNKGCASVHLLGGGGSGRVAAKTPALALCIAILRAKQGEG